MEFEVTILSEHSKANVPKYFLPKICQILVEKKQNFGPKVIKFCEISFFSIFFELDKKVDVIEMRSKLSPEEYVIPLNLILAAVHHCDFHFSKFNAFQILIEMTNNLTDQIVLERIVPTFLKFTR